MFSPELEGKGKLMGLGRVGGREEGGGRRKEGGEIGVWDVFAFRAKL